MTSKNIAKFFEHKWPISPYAVEYGQEFTKEEIDLATSLNLILFYGYSDDVVVMDGYGGCDEVGAAGKIDFYRSKNGYYIPAMEISKCEYNARIVEGWTPPAIVFSVLPGDGDKLTFDIKAENIPFAQFDIKEDGHLYGRGCVVDVNGLM